jgi:hypothetical protein
LVVPAIPRDSSLRGQFHEPGFVAVFDSGKLRREVASYQIGGTAQDFEQRGADGGIDVADERDDLARIRAQAARSTPTARPQSL